jgi:xylulokinase
MLNIVPAALPDNPAFISRLLIKTGIRKRLVVTMSWDPIAGNTISLSRLLVKILLKTTPLPTRSAIHCEAVALLFKPSPTGDRKHDCCSYNLKWTPVRLSIRSRSLSVRGRHSRPTLKGCTSSQKPADYFFPHSLLMSRLTNMTIAHIINTCDGVVALRNWVENWIDQSIYQRGPCLDSGTTGGTVAAERRNRFVLAVDLGTSGCKCALVGLDGAVHKWTSRSIPLHIVDRIGAEQAPEDWWNAFISAARDLIGMLSELRGEIAAICCSCQGECTVPVDKKGHPLRRAMLWLDMRGKEAIRRRAAGRIFSVAGYDAVKLFRWVKLSGGAPTLSGKDSLGHMAFIQDSVPAVYHRTYKFLNALDYMNLRLTGRFVATVDSILTSWVTDNRNVADVRYDPQLVAQSGVAIDKLPEIVSCTEVLGPLCNAAAEELGLPSKTLVVAGAVDNSAAAIGSGAVRDGEAHLYIGTSSWVGAHVPFKKTDVFAQIASVPCAIKGRYLAVALQSSAGSNLSFLCDKILFNEDGLGANRPADVYSALDRIAASSPAGARGLLYAPWLCGERSPVDDPSLRAGLLNMSLEHSHEDVIRAFLEGVALNTRWMTTPLNRFLGKSIDQITMVGGGATSDIWCQIFADVLGVPVRQPEAPIQANAVGAAMIAGVGIGAISFDDIPGLIRIRRTYLPDAQRKALYDQSFENFKFAHQQLAPLYRRMNSQNQVHP